MITMRKDSLNAFGALLSPATNEISWLRFSGANPKTILAKSSPQKTPNTKTYLPR